jgi:hypothetical protein
MSASRCSVAQRADGNSKRVRAPGINLEALPALGEALVAQISGSRAWFYSSTPDISRCRRFVGWLDFGGGPLWVTVVWYGRVGLGHVSFDCR